MIGIHGVWLASVIAHLAELVAVEVKAARSIRASLKATILASMQKKGLGSFSLPGLLKVNVVNVPAKKKTLVSRATSSDPRDAVPICIP